MTEGRKSLESELSVGLRDYDLELRLFFPVEACFTGLWSGVILSLDRTRKNHLHLLGIDIGADFHFGVSVSFFFHLIMNLEMEDDSYSNFLVILTVK